MTIVTLEKKIQEHAEESQNTETLNFCYGDEILISSSKNLKAFLFFSFLIFFILFFYLIKKQRQNIFVFYFFEVKIMQKQMNNKIFIFLLNLDYIAL